MQINVSTLMSMQVPSLSEEELAQATYGSVEVKKLFAFHIVQWNDFKSIVRLIILFYLKSLPLQLSHKEISFDIMFTRLRTNSTQINTNRQCMLKQIHVTTEWHVSHGFMVIATSYAFVSDFVTLHFCWLLSISKVITLCFWLPKIIFLPTCFHFNLSICIYL